MDLKGAVLKLAVPAWFLLVLGTVGAIYTGAAEPYLTPADVPVNQNVAIVGAIGLAIAGAAVFGFLGQRHKRDTWEAAGREAGLEPADGGTLPDLSGVVQGRTVDARVETRQVNQQQGTPTKAYTTYLETTVAGLGGEGAILGGGWGEIDADRGTVEFDALAESADDVAGLTSVSAGDLHAVGTSESTARALAGAGPQDALRSLGGLNLVYAGDAGRVVERHAEAENEALEDSVFGYDVDALLEAVPGDAETVSIETKRFIGDGDEVQRLAEAVVAVADAFEDRSGG